MINHQAETTRVWSATPAHLDFTNVRFQSEVTKMGKSNNHRHLLMTDKQLVLFKDKGTNAHRVLPLDFSTKFEVFRDAPIMKATAKKAPVGARADVVKPEDIQTLGDIQYIRLTTEHTDKVWDFSADQATLKQWRQALGTRINQIGFHHMFKVFKKIGKGNFASVYLAERIDDSQQMAIKAFSKSAVYAEENGKEGLINEITLMRELDNSKIMKLYEVFETQNSLYMGLELLQGGQLYDCLKKKVIFQNREIQIIMRGLLEGLAFMHAKNIMHRDLKLENILFKENNNIESVVIADFGLATFVDEPIYLYCRCGTPGFVAPEVINITDMTTTYGSVCDVYSLGLVFHILLTGKPGFPGRSYNTIVQQNKEAKVNFKSSYFDVVAPQAVDLLKKMLEPDPKKRITAQQAMKHDYVMAAVQIHSDDENIGDEQDDNLNLGQRISKINEESQKFDMLRINQLTNSPIKSPLMQATNKMKQFQTNEQHEEMIMRTPVITGKLQSVETSPMNNQGNQFVSPSVQFKHRQNQSIGQSVLSKYTNKPTQGLQKVQEQEGEGKDTNNLVKNVKSALTKNL